MTPDPSPSSAPSGGFTPRDEISDWSIDAAHELVRERLASSPHIPRMLLAIKDQQAAWEVLVTVARSVSSILRPAGHVGGVPGPIGDRNVHVYGTMARLALWGSLEAIEAVVTSAGRLIGCAADEDYPMCRALAAVVVSAPDPIGEARSVVRAMLEILAVEPVSPRPQEPSA